MTGSNVSMPDLRSHLRSSLLRPLLHPPVRLCRAIAFSASASMGKWRATPQNVKTQLIRSRLKLIDNPVFVETGTYFGDTLNDVRSLCSRLISIEIDSNLHARACHRFRKEPKIEILHGDCVSTLPGVLASLDRTALFWLDAHYSGGITGRGQVDDPIILSLNIIQAHALHSHIVLVDDALSFDGRESRPDLPDVLLALRAINPGYRLSVIYNVIVAEP